MSPHLCVYKIESSSQTLYPSLFSLVLENLPHVCFDLIQYSCIHGVMISRVIFSTTQSDTRISRVSAWCIFVCVGLEFNVAQNTFFVVYPCRQTPGEASVCGATLGEAFQPHIVDFHIWHQGGRSESILDYTQGIFVSVFEFCWS
jgi:hypothetical protein